MANNIELTDIPSDAESIDGLCDSDNEDEHDGSTDTRECNLILEMESSNNIDTIDSSDDEAFEQTVTNEKWTKSRKSLENIPFAEDVGPYIPDDIKSPKEIFLHLFTHDLLCLIVEQTNVYLKQNKLEQEISKEELLIFLGVNILMGIKKLPSYRDFWSSDVKLNDPFISSLMTVNRFGFFLSNIHIADNTKQPKKNCWKPNKYLSVDESMIKFKDRSSLKQYMPAKPIKRGYKCWVLADESSFVCKFQLYTGKTESTEKQLGARVVKDLTRHLVGKGYHVYFDNFFTGMDLMISLKKDIILACGTVRSNRTRLPKSDMQDKKMTHGQHDYKTSNTNIRWIKWMDKKPVHFLSNYHDPCEMTTVSRKQKDGSLKFVDCPVMCSDYNKHMGYVDNADRLLSTYKIDRKSRKWWLRLSLVNELVGYKIPTTKGRKRQCVVIGPHKPQCLFEPNATQKFFSLGVVAYPYQITINLGNSP
ncbi:PREDICTED: piggyBac transposable element-derived protein 3-like [Cyphomyrmex costatus]|uniref:piggyBac transposable element-derived protein 3-like n=1 Tax=Cyphomyrmex costatus TaxID=456900 RepID=UPI0008522734|nr:PREDICTED: piggyBac transposable element-derived protein 3-like [Cyphomyrmex costatus]